jgi:hypothetical protein
MQPIYKSNNSSREDKVLVQLGLPEERLIVRPDQMLDEMCATMGGRGRKVVLTEFQRALAI